MKYNNTSKSKSILRFSILSGIRGGAVIQATGRTDFEDGLWIGNQLLVRNGLQRVRTIPVVKMAAPMGQGAMTQGRHGPDCSGGRPKSCC